MPESATLTIQLEDKTPDRREDDQGDQSDEDVQAGKTGFIRSAGYCLATLLRLPQGSPVAVVVLGAKSNAGRFWETRHLFKWLSEKTGDLLLKEPEQK